MARTIAAIQKRIIDTYVAKRANSGIVVDPSLWSITDLKLLWSSIIATAAGESENLQDAFKADVEEIIFKQDKYKAGWYVDKMLYFRYGFNLLPDSDLYDNTGLTPANITAANVIKYAAALETQPGVRIKVATLDAATGDLAALPAPQLAAAKAYAGRIKPFGIYPLEVTTGPADKFKLKLLVKYDPLVLNANGERLDGTNNTPVQNAVNDYLKFIIFNGQLEIINLIDFLQLIDGVKAVYITEAATAYGALPYTTLTNFSYTADAGYLRIYNPADLVINWIAYV